MTEYGTIKIPQPAYEHHNEPWPDVGTVHQRPRTRHAGHRWRRVVATRDRGTHRADGADA